MSKILATEIRPRYKDVYTIIYIEQVGYGWIKEIKILNNGDIMKKKQIPNEIIIFSVNDLN